MHHTMDTLGANEGRETIWFPFAENVGLYRMTRDMDCHDRFMVNYNKAQGSVRLMSCGIRLYDQVSSNNVTVILEVCGSISDTEVGRGTRKVEEVRRNEITEIKLDNPALLTSGEIYFVKIRLTETVATEMETFNLSNYTRTQTKEGIAMTFMPVDQIVWGLKLQYI